jgi:hypothetical protein
MRGLLCDYSRFYGGWEDVGEGKMVGEGIGVLAGLSHAIHNLAGGMLCVAFLLWTPNYE